MEISKNLIRFLENISLENELNSEKKQEIKDLLKLIENVELAKNALRHYLKGDNLNRDIYWFIDGTLKLLEWKG